MYDSLYVKVMNAITEHPEYGTWFEISHDYSGESVREPVFKIGRGAKPELVIERKLLSVNFFIHFREGRTIQIMNLMREIAENHNLLYFYDSRSARRISSAIDTDNGDKEYYIAGMLFVFEPKHGVA